MAQNTTSIYLYTNGECKAEEFIESSNFSFNSDGTVRYVQFVEGETSIKLCQTAFYAKEFIERVIVYLVDESDIYLTDEFGNNLTALV